MKILHICPKYSKSASSGSTNVAFLMTQLLSKKEHHTNVYTTDVKNNEDSFHQTAETIGKVNVTRFKSIFKFLIKKIKIYITPLLYFRIGKELSKYDIIHMHEYRTLQNIIVTHIARKYKIPYIIQAHGSLPSLSERTFFKKIFDILFGYDLLRGSAMVIALNHTEAVQYRSMRVSRDNIAIIPNGVALSEYNNLPNKGIFKNKYRISEDDKIILYLGRINKIKGIDTLIKSFNEVVDKIENTVLVIVGPDDGHLFEVKKMIQQLYLRDKVLLTGPLYGVEKFEAYVDADVYILPSHFEMFPMSVLEAYACGNAVIASNVAGLRDLVIKGKTGLLFDKGNHDQLAEHILFLLNNENISQEMGINGKRFVKDNFTIERTVDKLEDLYNKSSHLHA